MLVAFAMERYVDEAVVVESFAFSAFCRSVWSESNPVIAPHATVALEFEANAQSYPVGEVEDALKNIPEVPVASDASDPAPVQYESPPIVPFPVVYEFVSV